MKKNIIITGALGLLGKPLTFELAKQGNNIIMLDLKSKNELKKYKNFEFVKDKIIYFKCDVSKIQNVKKVDNLLKKRFSKIDVLINAAAITDAVERKKNLKKSMFENYSIQDWEKSILVKLIIFLC